MARIKIDKVEDGISREIQFLDKTVKMIALTRDSKRKVFKVALAKAGQTETLMLPEEITVGFIQKGERRKELRRIMGKVISKLNLAAQKRR